MVKASYVWERKKPLRQQLLELLSDLEWHGYRELHDVAGYRYHARLHELKVGGYQVEWRWADEDGKDYRLRSLAKVPKRPTKVKAYLTEEEARSIVAGRVSQAALRAIEAALSSYRKYK